MAAIRPWSGSLPDLGQGLRATFHISVIHHATGEASLGQWDSDPDAAWVVPGSRPGPGLGNVLT